MEILDRLCRCGTYRVRNTDNTLHRVVPTDEERRVALGSDLVEPVLPGFHSGEPGLGEQHRLADEHRLAADRTASTLALNRFEVLNRLEFDVFLLGAKSDGFSDGMFRTRFERTGELQELVAVTIGDHVDERHGATGQSARLVEDHRVDALGSFEDVRVLEQHAHLGAPTGSDHDRRRCCESECTRTRDDQHGHGTADRGRDISGDDHPDDGDDDRDRDHNWNEHTRDSVCQFLHGCLCCLGVGDELHDLCQRSIGPDFLDLDLESSLLIDRCAKNVVAGLLRNRDALARQHRLIDTGPA